MRRVFVIIGMAIAMAFGAPALQSGAPQIAGAGLPTLGATAPADGPRLLAFLGGTAAAHPHGGFRRGPYYRGFGPRRRFRRRFARPFFFRRPFVRRGFRRGYRRGFRRGYRY